ncbi:hypothetical protein OBBRIDRAFT_790088 [Obba rivulosa]|uniref:Uncharacterized protein n=1 Tax=Obba rivulosa TaxID=1052685 RepID=A0A8E2J310_9APHY|nr:hypothetical protein OBBRIDRAFT_790088 [Obba rivulosa]
MWFEETGESISEEEQKKRGLLLSPCKTSIRQKLREVGQKDNAPKADEGSMIETTGTRIDEAEVELLADLLEKMLRYHPEDRIPIMEVVRHPWYGYESSPCTH